MIYLVCNDLIADNYSHLNHYLGVILVVLLTVSSVSSSVFFGLEEAEHCPHPLALLQQVRTLL